MQNQPALLFSTPLSIQTAVPDDPSKTASMSSPGQSNIPLLTFDIKMDSLRSFLENMANIVNDHA